MKSQPYGHLNKTYTKRTPVVMPMWMGKALLIVKKLQENSG